MVKQDIFKMGEGGYAVFRLPALLHHDGVFLAFCEGRYGVADSSVADIVIRRGVLKGSSVTWGGIQVIARKKGVRLHNPVPLVDKKNNVIWVLYKTSDSSLMLIKSSDCGVTWSDPRDIRKEIFNQMPADVVSFTPGPAHGIQLKSGRLVIQGYALIKEETHKIQTDHGVVLLSDDHGETWFPGGYIPAKTENGTDVQTNETAVVELADDTITLNCRTLARNQPRAQAFSNDGGKTFNPPELMSKLIEPKNIGNVPAGCEGSVLGFQAPNKGTQPWALFANPASTYLRRKMSIRLSQDGCRSWSKAWDIRWFASGYSDMTQYEPDDNNNGHCDGQQANPNFAILYESGIVRSYAQVTFQTFTLQDVMKGCT